MRAITVRQPWARSIAVGAKNVENRSAGFPSAYRGPLLVHAAAATWAGTFDPTSPAHLELLRLVRADLAGLYTADLGHVLAVVDLVDVHPDGGCCRPWGESAYTADDGKPRRGVVHLVLENARALRDPVPARGALGLWRPPLEVLDAVHEQLEAV